MHFGNFLHDREIDGIISTFQIAFIKYPSMGTSYTTSPKCSGINEQLTTAHDPGAQMI